MEISYNNTEGLCEYKDGVSSCMVWLRYVGSFVHTTDYYWYWEGADFNVYSNELPVSSNIKGLGDSRDA